MRSLDFRTKGRSEGGLVLVAAFVCLVVALSGLANRGADAGNDLLSLTRAAAEKGNTFRFTMTQKFTGPGTESFGAGSPFSFEGAVDIKAGLSRFVTTIKAPGINAKCTYVAAGDDFFVSVHPSRRATIGASWLRTDAKNLLGNQSFQIRPDQLYEDEAGFFSELEKLGTEVVGGVKTTKYGANVGIADLVAQAKDNPALAGFKGTVPVAAYLDETDRIRRLTFGITAGRGYSLTMTIDFLDYGKPLSITRPPANQVKAGNAQQTTTACFPNAFPGR